ncbi:MAG: GGDEF domain-containing protein [Candidatus Thiodiazotropha sp.]
MNNMLSSGLPEKATPFNSRLGPDLHEELINKIYVIGGVLASILLVFPLMRAFETGWLDIYAVHIASYVLIVGVVMGRRRLPTGFKINTIVLLSLVNAMAGYQAFGLMAGSVFSLPIAGILLGLFSDRRLFVLFGVICLTDLMLLAWAFTTGVFEPAVNPKYLMNSASHWLTYGVGMTFFLLISMVTLQSYRQTMQDLVRQIEIQRDEITQLANYDTLTGLPTLRLAQDRLEMTLHRARRTRSHAAVLFIDLDNFKQVNDNYGHDAGDYCLKQTGQRMIGVIRSEDTVARIGGDEFLVIVDALSAPQQAELLAEKLLSSIAEPIEWKDAKFSISGSVGISLFPEHGDTPAELRCKADQAMYKAKNKRKGCFAWAV